jgi:DNA-binding response OmpR family regulator
MDKLTGKHILILKGSLIADAHLRDTLMREGAKVTVTANIVTAFDLVNRKHFDGAVVDHGLHNEAFDFCTELQALSIPYISANTPHRLQGLEARERDAKATVHRLVNVLEIEADDVFADDYPDNPPCEFPPELRAM